MSRSRLPDDPNIGFEAETDVISTRFGNSLIVQDSPAEGFALFRLWEMMGNRYSGRTIVPGNPDFGMLLKKLRVFCRSRPGTEPAIVWFELYPLAGSTITWGDPGTSAYFDATTGPFYGCPSNYVLNRPGITFLPFYFGEQEREDPEGRAYEFDPVRYYVDDVNLFLAPGKDFKLFGIDNYGGSAYVEDDVIISAQYQYVPVRGVLTDPTKKFQ